MKTHTLRLRLPTLVSLALALALPPAGCATVDAAAPQAAATPEAAAPEASGGRIQPAAAGQFETWAYVTIRNAGAADALVGAQSPDAASVVLRATIVTDAGRTVRSVAAIPVPARGVLVLGADTYFLAFIQARHAFVPGQHIQATLRFTSGAQRVVDFLVADREGDPADAGQ